MRLNVSHAGSSDGTFVLPQRQQQNLFAPTPNEATVSRPTLRPLTVLRLPMRIQFHVQQSTTTNPSATTVFPKDFRWEIKRDHPT